MQYARRRHSPWTALSRGLISLPLWPCGTLVQKLFHKSKCADSCATSLMRCIQSEPSIIWSSSKLQHLWLINLSREGNWIASSVLRGHTCLNPTELPVRSSTRASMGLQMTSHDIWVSGSGCSSESAVHGRLTIASRGTTLQEIKSEGHEMKSLSPNKGEAESLAAAPSWFDISPRTNRLSPTERRKHWSARLQS